MRLSVSTYIPGASPVHRLDARVKVALLAAYSAALLLVSSWPGLLLATALLAATLAASALPLRRVLALGAPAYAIAAFSVAFNACVLVGPDGAAAGVLPLVGGVALSGEGLSRGLMLGLRIVLLTEASLVVSLTSTSTELGDALRSILAPLRPLRVPVDDVATALSLAVRFIPLTAEELCVVRDAQWSRGAPFDGGPVARMRAWSAVMIPLFVGLFRRADVLSRAMDARCYGLGRARTSLARRTMGASDWLALVIGLAACAALALG
ncbi:MAG: energy-coupling factor transporter transmembrane protein EcfT [Eggerthellaceae bacterium]|nr:energy-coupling factor transporter transmembrane protein EcfT [Eggerthellaceae bacterium]